MKIQKIFSKFNLRTISAAICVSLVSSCAYESYPVNSSYGSSGSPYTPYSNAPYRSNSTVSDPTIPLILGASAIGAIAYFGKKNHDSRHRSDHYSHRNHYNNGSYSNNHYNHRSNNYSSQRNHNVHYNNSHRNNHTSSYNRTNRNTSKHSSHSNHNSNAVRNSYRNSAREALERKRDSQRNSQRSRPQINRNQRSQVVSNSSSRS